MKQNKKKLIKTLENESASLHKLLLKLVLREDIAEDLFQELFLKILDRNFGFTIKNPKNYLKKVAINLALDWRKQEILKKTNLASIAKSETYDDTPVSKIVQNEQIKQVLNGISMLKKSYREIIVLRYVEQLSYEQIAQRNGKTKRYWRGVCFKAMEKLRSIIK